MKRFLPSCLLALVLLGLYPSSLYAGLNTYTFSQASGTYTTLTTTSILTTASEYHVQMPFVFKLDSLSSDSLWVNVLGFAGLKKTNVASTGSDPLSQYFAYNGVMSPFGGAFLVTGYSGNAIRTATSGTAPNRVFTVQWQNFGSSTGGIIVNFQLRLHETTNVVDFVYGSFTSTPSNNNFMWSQVGMRLADTSILSGSVVNRRSGPATSAYWTATQPSNSAATIISYSSTLSVTAPPSGLTFSWTPAPACSATLTAGLLQPDSQLVCYGSTALLSPTGTPDSLQYQWQTSANGSTWTNYTGGFGGIFLTELSAPVTNSPVYYRQRTTCLVTSGVAYTKTIKLKPTPAQAPPYSENFEAALPTGQYLPGLYDCVGIRRKRCFSYLSSLGRKVRVLS